MLTPREQHRFFGHHKIEESLLKSWQSDRMPHGLLLHGPSGIGKATLAFRLARFLLTSDRPENFDISSDSPVFRRVAAGGHGDLLVIEPTEKAEISVEQVRKVGRFLSQTPMEGGWRVVIIDGPMNHNAANALLKSLEEPPEQAMLIIIADSLGQIMPTIRSRCTQIAMQPLPLVETAAVIEHVSPDLKCENILRLAQGRPGYALHLHEAGADEIYEDIEKLWVHLNPFSLTEVHKFCEKYSAKAKKEHSADPFTLVGDMLLQHLFTKRQENLTFGASYQFVEEVFKQAKFSHLDRYQTLMHVFGSLR